MTLSSVTFPSCNSETSKWQIATWDDYLAYRDHPHLERVKVFYQDGYLWSEMGSEGINHASISDLFTMLFAFWFARFPVAGFSSLGRSLEQLTQIDNGMAALWFNQQIANINPNPLEQSSQI